MLMLIGPLSGCGDPSSQVEGGGTSAAGHGSTTLPAQRFGVIAQVEFDGDKSRLDENSRVYVFLREPGRRMPIVVQHFEARALPKQVALYTESPQSNVELVARLSLSGRVERSPGDIEAIALLDRIGHPPISTRLLLSPQSMPRTSSRTVDETRPVEVTPPEPLVVHAFVTIDSTEGLTPEMPVFVIAKAGRSPMPLAVRKLAVRDLPARIELSDADSMLLTRRLSTAQEFTLQARVSVSQRAQPSLGDPESQMITINPDAIPDAVTLAIHATGESSSER